MESVLSAVDALRGDHRTQYSDGRETMPEFSRLGRTETRAGPRSESDRTTSPHDASATRTVGAEHSTDLLEDPPTVAGRVASEGPGSRSATRLTNGSDPVEERLADPGNTE
jgi:hypothetical protein